MQDWREILDQTVDQQVPELVQLRRHLHMYPELSGQEYESTRYLVQWLEANGIDAEVGPDARGVIANLNRKESLDAAGLFALRADMDALAIQDSKSVKYCSRHPGVMHACGHDAHTAMVAGALTAISSLHAAGHLSCDLAVRGIFQPAEETSEGAMHMINAGALANVDAICASHVDPSRVVGKVGLRYGLLTANCDEICVSIRGEGGHSARPHQTRDPVSAAAQLINTVYLNIPRNTDSQDAVVVTFCAIRGGQNSNVIPDHVDLKGTLRTLDPVVRDATMAVLQRLAESVGAVSQTEISLDFSAGSGAVRNDIGISDIIMSEAKSCLGSSSIERIPRPSMGSEDYAFFTDRIPGAMFRLGCVSTEDQRRGLHTSSFDVDERCLAIGAKLLARTAVSWLYRGQNEDSSSEIHAREEIRSTEE